MKERCGVGWLKLVVRHAGIGTQLLCRPECDVLLAHCATFLARARKSHAVYGALGRAYDAVDIPGPGGLLDVPLHLRPPTSSVGRELGWGSGYSANLSTVGGLRSSTSQTLCRTRTFSKTDWEDPNLRADFF